MADAPTPPQDDLGSQSLVKDFLQFLKEEKIWWILPLVVVLALLGLLAFAAGSAGPLAPFLYPFA